MAPPPLLTALAATFAPGRAAAALARHADRAVATEASRLAPLPREERLSALREALSALPGPSRAAAAACAARERPALATLLRDGAGPDARSVHPLIRRLVEEREWT
jgi:hypothetical protein